MGQGDTGWASILNKDKHIVVTTKGHCELLSMLLIVTKTAFFIATIVVFVIIVRILTIFPHRLSEGF